MFLTVAVAVTVSSVDGAKLLSPSIPTSVRSGIGTSDRAIALTVSGCPGAVTSSSCSPNVDPRVHSVVASPFASVSTAATVTVPLPAAGAKVIANPGMPEPP